MLYPMAVTVDGVHLILIVMVAIILILAIFSRWRP